MNAQKFTVLTKKIFNIQNTKKYEKFHSICEVIQVESTCFSFFLVIFRDELLFKRRQKPAAM